MKPNDDDGERRTFVGAEMDEVSLGSGAENSDAGLLCRAGSH